MDKINKLKDRWNKLNKKGKAIVVVVAVGFGSSESIDRMATITLHGRDDSGSFSCVDVHSCMRTWIYIYIYVYIWMARQPTVPTLP